LRLAEAFWPGPLSLVVERADDVPDILCGGGDSLALRAPNHPVALEFIRQVGDGVTAPSANRASRLPPLRAAHVLKSLDGRIDLLLDGGTCPGGLESTVLDVRGSEAIVLRRGGVPVEAIRKLVPVQDLQSTTPASSLNPEAWLQIADAKDFEPLARELAKAGPIAVVGSHAGSGSNRKVLSDDPKEYGVQIYDVLHDLEDAGYRHVIVEALPQDSAWAALRDRLDRLAAASVAPQ
jgi:L-threonylcarbamoyladenylate synthase